MIFRRGVAVFLCGVLGLAPGAEVALAQNVQPEELSKELMRDRIAAGDVISIGVFPSEEYSREVTVQPDGKISMPLIGTISVRGLSIRELQSTLEKRYSQYVANPQVTANVRSFSGRSVAIIGEIHNPGYYPYRDGMKLLELMSLAGGPGPDARTARVRVIRPGASGSRSFSVNFAAVLEGDTTRDPILAPGDTVYVPQQPFTEQSAWVNRNFLPWALLTSMLASIIVATRR